MEWIKSLTLATRATVIGVAVVGLTAIGLRVAAGLGKADDVVATPTVTPRSQEAAAQPTRTPNATGLETATFALG
jgi:hypothetical protein